MMKWNTKPLSKAFGMMRGLGLLAEQNYLCCQTCGVHAMQERADKDFPENAKPLGYCFYHVQDRDFLKERGVAHLAFNAFGSGDSVAVGRIIVHCLKQSGVSVKWDGTAAQRIQFSLKGKDGE
jgi:hypothetical protein